MAASDAQGFDFDRYPDPRVARRVAKQMAAGRTLGEAEAIVARRLEDEISRSAAASVARAVARGEWIEPFDPGAFNLPGDVLVRGDVKATMDVHHAHDDPDLRALLGDEA